VGGTKQLCLQPAWWLPRFAWADAPLRGLSAQKEGWIDRQARRCECRIVAQPSCKPDPAV